MISPRSGATRNQVEKEIIAADLFDSPICGCGIQNSFLNPWKMGRAEVPIKPWQPIASKAYF
jgi:hypothetical protein